MIQAQTKRLGPVEIYTITEPRLRRFGQLFVGLPLFGIALALSIEATLGVNPWTVFSQGVAKHTPLTVGTATMVTGLVLLVAFPLFREPMGLGTLLNVVVIGAAIDVTLAIVPDLTSMPVRLLALAVSPILIGLASGLYIGAGLGPGPRDGVMTALERRGMPVWLARTAIEATALLLGWILGGNVGLGTVWMAASVGVFVDFFLSRLRMGVAT